MQAAAKLSLQIMSFLFPVKVKTTIKVVRKLAELSSVFDGDTTSPFSYNTWVFFTPGKEKRLSRERGRKKLSLSCERRRKSRVQRVELTMMEIFWFMPKDLFWMRDLLFHLKKKKKEEKKPKKGENLVILKIYSFCDKGPYGPSTFVLSFGKITNEC